MSIAKRELLTRCSTALSCAGLGASLFSTGQAYSGPRYLDVPPVVQNNDESRNSTSTPGAPASLATASKSTAAVGSSPATSTASGETEKKAETETPRYLERGYRHEFLFTGDVDFVKGATKSRPDETGLSEQSLDYRAELIYGYFIAEFVEPVIEVAYSQQKNKLGEFDGTSRSFSWGAGLLFNLPIVPDDKPVRMHFARWVPFGGLLVMSENSLNDGRLASTSTSNNKSLMTNLIVGARYLAFPNVSINSSIRMSYEKSSTAAEAEGKSGGERSKTRIQARLFGLSLLF
ncbi:MAG: hypothetical protein FJY29_04895 [Betaproteobacteria bacterium]|nr:hypothetical protein [Betaproteobacteria bacterium]